jgi:hypothetical protein
VTGDPDWLNAVNKCITWFFSDNDVKIPMLDERTGGGCDSLGRTSRSRNKGGASTLAMISVLQRGRRVLAASP